MQIISDIKWKDDGSVSKMVTHLNSFAYNKMSNLNMIFGGLTSPSLTNTEISVRCGNYPQRSAFVFTKAAGKKSQIIGCCSSDNFAHLIDDFEYLKEQMKPLKNEFKITDPRIKVNDKSLVKKRRREYISKRSVLVDLFTLTGIIPFISSYLLSGGVTWNTLSNMICPAVVGFIFWVATLCIGYGSEPEYALEK